MRLFQKHNDLENFQTLERWRATCAKYQIWLSEFPEICLVLRNLSAESERERLDACWPPRGEGPWEIDGLRQFVRKSFINFCEENITNIRAEYWKAEKLASDAEIERLRGIASALSVKAIKWCPNDHYDFDSVCALARNLDEPQ